MGVQVVTTCSAHGIAEWKGHVMCLHCGKVYAIEELPETCSGEECGESFAGIQKDGLEAELRLTYDRTLPIRRICYRCFKHFSKKGGRVPVEKRKPS